MHSAQTPELKTRLAGTIARALAVFCVDEVITFNDAPPSNEYGDELTRQHFTGYDDPSYFLTHILSYLETPPFLRVRLFPLHPDLKYAGAAPSLDMPHHLKPGETCPYREGISVKSKSGSREKQEPVPNGEHLEQKKRKKKKNATTEDETAMDSTHHIDVGFSEPVEVSTPIPLNNRVTVHFSDPDDVKAPNTVVQPTDPRTKSGYYWGYSVRAASSISSVMTECPFDGGYDVTLGTSERGSPLSDLRSCRAQAENTDSAIGVPKHTISAIPPFRHMLVAFGGVSGLEAAAASDEVLQEKGVTDAKDLFDFWVNICPGQGSRTIRTEEAIWVALAHLKEIVDTNGICEFQ